MSRVYNLYAPCHFGMEAVLKREIINLGYEVSKVEDGRVYFLGDDEAIARANINLRTTERIMILVDSFKASTYEELFQGIKRIEWQEYLPINAKFPVKKASSIKSKLFSPSDIQSIVKKAIVEKLKIVYNKTWFEEGGAEYPLRISLNKDIVTVGLDTTGESLHKRGYRKMTAKAPITETLAAAIILLSPWKKDRVLIDPFCGSGTFLIEAAMIALNIAPGKNREFLSMEWDNLIPKKVWYDAFDEAEEEEIKDDIKLELQGYDIDETVIKAAKQNAENAGLEKYIHFQKRDVNELSTSRKYGFIITNPPYGERLEDKESLPPLYKILGERFSKMETWSMFMISSFEDAPKYIKRPLTKNRKIYNGMIKTYLYTFMGEKPKMFERDKFKKE